MLLLVEYDEDVGKTPFEIALKYGLEEVAKKFSCKHLKTLHCIKPVQRVGPQLLSGCLNFPEKLITHSPTGMDMVKLPCTML